MKHGCNVGEYFYGIKSLCYRRHLLVKRCGRNAPYYNNKIL
ncbi:MAG: hypothetical protein C5S49_00280 [Candidatus Methanogaster sp.]|nr:MAG: hypothetical protein C5S49_00280 [ANME-2 cluster archaeon]